MTAVAAGKASIFKFGYSGIYRLDG